MNIHPIIEKLAAGLHALVRSFTQNWKIFLSAFAIILFIAFVGTIFYVRGRILMQNQIKDKLRSTAAAAAMQFDGDALERIRVPKDAALRGYRDTLDRLMALRNTVQNLRFAYIMRRTDNPNVLAFIVDADQGLPSALLDTNKNGIIESDEAPAAIGDQYDVRTLPALRDEAFLHPSVDSDIGTDQWGSVISGYAPIRDSKGQVVAVLGIDMDAADYHSFGSTVFSPLAFLLVVIAASVMVGAIFLHLSRTQIDELRKLDAERSGLLRLTFHQLGGPLTILNWSLEALREHKEGESMERQIVSMEEGMARLANILNSLRDANQVHEGTMEYQPAFGSLTDIITKVAREYEGRLQRSRQSIILSLHADLKMKLDKKLITAVMRELLGNAMDFSPPGNTITIRTSQDKGAVQVEVHDQGYGIPAEDQKHIFEQFMRGSNATKYKPDGSGLGLYIVRGIIERAGGSIWIESAPGKGTSAFFRLPMAT